MEDRKEAIWELLRLLFKAHPWHGVSIGDQFPEFVTTYIEVVPSDTVKYELDKDSGILKVDRPQVFSNVCPAMYGMIPQTFCGEATAAYCEAKTGRTDIVGDQDLCGNRVLFVIARRFGKEFWNAPKFSKIV